MAADVPVSTTLSKAIPQDELKQYIVDNTPVPIEVAGERYK